jgi:hypothetical protein
MTKVVWYARSGLVLSLLMLLVVLTAIFVKTPVTGREGDPRLLSTSTDPLGAALFFNLAKRLGYTAQRATSPDQVLPRGAIVTELDPVDELTPPQVHRLLDHVRAGGALFAVLGTSTRALSDSIHVSVDPLGRQIESRLGDARTCTKAAEFTRTGLWFGTPTLLGLKVRDSLNSAQRTFIFVGAASLKGSAYAPRPAMIGIPLGAGRIVVASDPDVLRNDALRNCSYGLDVAAVAALRYLTDGGAVPRRTVIFDDSHLKKPVSTGPLSVVRSYLVRTASGRFVFQLCGAGLLLLLATAPRVLSPRDDARIERRSPLEHVDALARAYGQVGATRTGAMRLVRGLERRVGATSRGTGQPADEHFLTRIAESTPSVASDVAVVRHALGHTVNTKEFVEVGRAIGRIEQALTHT